MYGYLYHMDDVEIFQDSFLYSLIYDSKQWVSLQEVAGEKESLYN